LGSGDFEIDTEVTDLVVSWGPTAFSLYTLTDGVKIVECDISALALCSHPSSEITSCPSTIRILQ
jgi:hypothetical protein